MNDYVESVQVDTFLIHSSGYGPFVGLRTTAVPFSPLITHSIGDDCLLSVEGKKVDLGGLLSWFRTRNAVTARLTRRPLEFNRVVAADFVA